MKSTLRGIVLVGLLALGLSACGGSTATKGKGGGTVTIVSAAAPDSVDPQLGSTGQAREALWNVYTPLLTVKHADGEAGMEVIPGLATALPEITDGGRTYTLTLRKGRRYSDGRPVKASDFRHAIERALRLNWPEAALFTDHIVGASAFLARKARHIDGIAADDGSGRITVRLKAPYGPFAAILALPSAAPVPSDTPMKPQNTDPPPGDGPFMFASATPNRGFTLVKNPRYRPLPACRPRRSTASG